MICRLWLVGLNTSPWLQMTRRTCQKSQRCWESGCAPSRLRQRARTTTVTSLTSWSSWPKCTHTRVTSGGRWATRKPLMHSRAIASQSVHMRLVKIQHASNAGLLFIVGFIAKWPEYNCKTDYKSQCLAKRFRCAKLVKTYPRELAAEITNSGSFTKCWHKGMNTQANTKWPLFNKPLRSDLYTLKSCDEIPITCGLFHGSILTSDTAKKKNV